MRLFVDTNIFIAYLISPRKDSFVTLLLEKIEEGEITLLVSEGLLDEIEVTVKRKAKLLKIIGEDRLAQFIAMLKLISEEIPKINEPIPPITRDPKDDYLIAYSVVGQADYLISGDKDLLVLEEIHGVKILTSGEFRNILR